MKHQSISSFFSSPCANVNLVIMNGSQEREQIFQKLVGKDKTIEKLLPDLELHVLLDALNSPSLFGGQRVVLLDECDLLSKKNAEKLSEFLETHVLDCLFLLGSKGKTPLMKVIEKVGSVLDMSSEKPWERDKRLKESILHLCKEKGKWLSSDAADLLIEKIGPDFSSLSQEIHKLDCFVGERQNIDRMDVLRICSTNALDTPWKIAEEMVWEAEGSQIDPTIFFGLIYSIRVQLQMGAKMISLIEAEVPLDEWSAHFPKVWPKTLEKRKAQAMKRGSIYFQKGLETLFRIELLSRTGASPTPLFDLFRTSLRIYG